MVGVGDKVFVAPLHGQKDNLVVISAGNGGGITEGDYNTWTKEWFWDYPLGLEGTHHRVSYYIDEANAILYIWLDDLNGDTRFCSYNLADHTTIFESTGGTDYIHFYPYFADKQIDQGVVTASGGISKSIQTYLALFRDDAGSEYKIIEVWKDGAKLWSYDTSADYQAHAYNDNAETFCISLTGKYILVWTYYADLILYKGSSV